MSTASKIRDVMKAVGSLDKTAPGQGGGLKYSYLSEETVVTALHKACADAGLVIVPSTMAILDRFEYPTSGGSIMRCVNIQVTYSLMDADDPKGEALTIMTLGEGADTSDKAMNKAMTAAFKYALRQSFLISTGDDPDKEPSVEGKESQRREATTSVGAAAKEKAASTTVEGGKGITVKQMELLHKLAGDLFGRDADGVAEYKAWLGEQFQVDSSKQLTKSGASSVIDALQRKIDDLGEEQAA